MLDATAVTPTRAPIIIVSIPYSPSYIDIYYHDILSLSLFIYLSCKNDKLKIQKTQKILSWYNPINYTYT